MKISAVIPVYNEVDNVVELSKRINKTLKDNKTDFELIYVVQGKDGTYEKLVKLKKDIPEIRLKYFPNALGLGPAFRVGFNMISDDCTHVLTMDGDLNHQPEEIPMFIEKMKETNSDIIIGSRKVEGGTMVNMPLPKKMISSFTNLLLMFLFNIRVKDLTSGYRFYKKKVIINVRKNLKSRNFEFIPEVLILSKKRGYKMTEVPIKFKFRIHGESKLNFVTSGIGYVKLLFRTMFI